MPAFAWPFSVCALILVLGLVILFQHRDAIGRFIDRTKHIGKAGVTTSDTTAIATQTETKDIAKPSAADDLLRSFDNQLLVEQESLIVNFLNERNILDSKDRERVLTRYLASSYLVNRFEAVYAGIFGSQLQALQMLNQSAAAGLSTAALEGWYNIGVAGHPHLYGNNGENYAFGQWLGYMYRRTLLTMVGNDAHITLFGQEFLKYIIQNSYSLDRTG